MTSTELPSGTMRAVQITTYEGVPGTELREIAIPKLTSGHALVRVHTAGVNPVDVKVAKGVMNAKFPTPLPITSGGEIAGSIVALGDPDSEWQVGDAVHAVLGYTGAFADFALVPSDKLVRKPSALSFAEAAALPSAVATSQVVLDTGEISAGSRIVIHAAAGGVGTTLLQLAKARGAHVTALASADNFDYVAALGADVVVDRNGDQVSEIRDADVVVDAYGPATHERSWAMLRPGGILLSLVSPPDAETAEKHQVRAQQIFGDMNPEYLREADRLVEAGKLRAHVTRRFPLEHYREALELIESGQSRGKIILDLSEGDANG